MTHPDPYDDSPADREADAVRQRLRENIEATRLHFLRTELQVAATMLDVAGGTLRDAVRTRRRALAQETHDEVARQLAKGTALGLTASEFAEVQAGLAEIEARLDATPH